MSRSTLAATAVSVATLAVPAVASAAPKHSLKVSTGKANIQRLAEKNHGHFPAFSGACHHARTTGLFSTVNWRKVSCQVVVFTPVTGTPYYKPVRFIGTATLSARGVITTTIRPA